MAENNDIFDKAPGFLAAFERIVSEGSFSQLDVNFTGFEGKILSLHIKATGHIPSSPEYAYPGVKAYFDPKDVLDRVKAQIEERPVTFADFEVKSGNWLIYGEPNDEVIGSKGIQTTFSMSLTFKN